MSWSGADIDVIIDTAKVITHSKEHVQNTKIYNIGIQEDPIPGEKRGKGVQNLNSSHFMMAFMKHMIPGHLKSHPKKHSKMNSIGLRKTIFFHMDHFISTVLNRD